jgi:hypothetical protein
MPHDNKFSSDRSKKTIKSNSISHAVQIYSSLLIMQEKPINLSTNMTAHSHTPKQASKQIINLPYPSSSDLSSSNVRVPPSRIFGVRLICVEIENTLHRPQFPIHQYISPHKPPWDFSEAKWGGGGRGKGGEYFLLTLRTLPGALYLSVRSFNGVFGSSELIPLPHSQKNRVNSADEG